MIGRKIKNDCGSFPSFRDWIWLGKLSWGRNVYLTLERKKEYGNRTYYYHCNGKWLMDFHGSLLMFLFYLEYERNIRKVIHTKTM